MEQSTYENYLWILKEELVPALGCTEPIALAYAAAKAREVLGEFPESMKVWCSGNIIKNVKGVTVPNSNGLKGIEAAAILGAVGGDGPKELEVLEAVTEEAIAQTIRLLKEGFCSCELAKGVENLYIRVTMAKGAHSSEVILEKNHTHISRICKDGAVIYENPVQETKTERKGDKSLLDVREILKFAEEVKLTDIEEVIGRQIRLNMAISDEGLQKPYGAEVGRTLLEVYGDDVVIRAKARAAAGSDARMNGCPLPVVINSGSGNQGMTCSLPVIEFAKKLYASEETLYRALVISNLIAIHQKKYIGSLSAYCGAVSAACGAGAAITWLYGGDYEAVSRTITNTIANVGGMICDGAKASCAAKIASAVDAAIMGHFLGNKNHCFQAGDGIVQDTVEKTIQSVGYIGKEGMKETDLTILSLMIELC